MADQEARVIIISGGVGASAEQLLNTVLAQFPRSPLLVQTQGNIRQPEQIRSALASAVGTGALVIHTLVDSKLRSILIDTAHELGIQEIDLMGPIIDWLSNQLNQPPLEQPGLYRRLNKDYFERVAAIDFTMAHDDGKNINEWDQAEIILVGVSRVGKTPLSLYLAVLGWKVANLPIIPDITLPENLFLNHSDRIIGLTIDPEQLMVFRRRRQARLGVSGSSAYVNLEAIQQELVKTNRVFRQSGFHIIDMTDKTIELAADEILRRMANHKGLTLGG